MCVISGYLELGKLPFLFTAFFSSEGKNQFACFQPLLAQKRFLSSTCGRVLMPTQYSQERVPGISSTQHPVHEI